MASNKKPRDPYKCGQRKGPHRFNNDKSNRGILGWLKGLLERMGVMSKDPNCRFPWLVPWPIGTKRKCCPKKNELPVMNPLETKCVYKPLVKTCQIWIYMVRGLTVPKWAQIERCTGKPCKR